MEIVFKTVDACNNRCKYCFYFRERDRNLINKDKFIVTRKTIDKVANFLKIGCDELKINGMNIIFHGGEPLLQKQDDFSYMCQQFIDILGPKLKSLGLQTNGTLISESWMELFEKYKVKPSISIDGYKECHDELRLDNNSNGTYDKVVAAIHLMKKKKYFQRLGTLSVVNPKYSAKKIYRHFVDDLKLNYMDFLLPDVHHDTLDYLHRIGIKLEFFEEFLCELFDEWVKDDNPSISIRLFKEILLLLSGHRYSSLGSFGPYKSEVVLPVITILRDGRLAPEDNLVSAKSDILDLGANIDNISLSNFVKLPIFSELREIRKNLPQACGNCTWAKICNGGDTINRYSRNNGFNNPSVYCSALQGLYSHIATYMIKNGFSTARLRHVLNLHSED